MNTTLRLGGFKALVLIATFLTISCAQLAFAGEVSVYLKSGWFSWDEKLNGSSFVKEKGFMHAAGIQRKDTVSNLSIAELAEVWGGNLDYDGHDVTGANQLKSDTSYLGTREEVALGLKLPTGDTVGFEPFAAVGHKFWVRTRSSEDWNTFYAKAGVCGEFKSSGSILYLKGGALIPLYTRTHASLSGAGYNDVTTTPKNEISGFAEGGVKMGAFAVSLEYEGMSFGESSKVGTARTFKVPNGVVIQNSTAFQPDSKSSIFSLKLAYSF